MRRRAPSSSRTPENQRGFAMIVVIAIVVLLSAYFIASGLNRTSTQLSHEREARTMAALLKAKSALIAYAASEQWQQSMGQVTKQPGALPCPDRDNDGKADCVWLGITNSVSLIGQLPWQTIGTEDLRDASGERLWYAVSRNFRKLSGVTVINSDTQGQLTVTGAAAASNVVAVVIAPGPVIQGQNRGASPPNVSSYLESFNVNDGVNFIFTTNALPSDSLNDRLVTITQADLMAVVEPAVAAMIERDVKPYLKAYFDQWGAFPYPAPFNTGVGPGTAGTRPQSAYVGDTAQSAGLLPITNSAPYGWTSGSVTQVGGTGRIENISCSNATSSCSFRARDDSGSMLDLRFQVSGQTGTNAGVTLAKLPAISVIATLDGSSSTFLSPTLSASLISSGAGTVTYEATVPINCSSGCSNHNVVVTIPIAAAELTSTTNTVALAGASNTSPITITTSSAHNFPTGARVTIAGVSGNTAANGNWNIVVTDGTHFTLTGSQGNGNYTSGGTAASGAAWFIANEWFRQTYYAVSPGHLPGGAGSCSARPALPAGPISPSCLMVTNLSSAYAVPNDKRAILILAGRAMNGSTRPSTNLANYLESANATFAANPYVFENRPGVPTSINDRVVVVSP